jgi:N utilization substance protein A
VSLGAIPGVSDMFAELLYQAGFKSAEEVAEADLETIADVDGVTPEKAEAIFKSSREYVAEKKKREEEEAAEKKKREEEEAKAAAEAAASAADGGAPTEGGVASGDEAPSAGEEK